MAFIAPAQYSEESVDVLLRLIAVLSGEDAVKVVKVLLNEKEVSDEVLAEKTGMRLNQVRRILYDLLDKHIVTYRREASERGGYHLYIWSLNGEGLRRMVKERKGHVLNRLRERLLYEQQNMFFVCPNGCNGRVTFDKAMDHQFKCSKCGAILQSFDNSKIIEKLRLRIESLEKDP
ncbi:MAG: hypothetical protein QXD66_06760 [Candidatus Nezhaarchaeales archaeon]|nr:MAG: transcription factor [Candidatus Nezhaarchaeota archaeon WYZ-LMO7]